MEHREPCQVIGKQALRLGMTLHKLSITIEKNTQRGGVLIQKLPTKPSKKTAQHQLCGLYPPGVALPLPWHPLQLEDEAPPPHTPLATLEHLHHVLQGNKLLIFPMIFPGNLKISAPASSALSMSLRPLIPCEDLNLRLQDFQILTSESWASKEKNLCNMSIINYKNPPAP